jgi:hypothetical protein
MPHVRQQIRDLIRTQLRQRLERVEQRVDYERGFPLAVEDMPCVRLGVELETVETMDMEFGGSYQRTLTLVVSCYSTASSQLPLRREVWNELDDMCAEIEVLFAEQGFLGEIASPPTLAGIEFEFDAAGETPIGVARMRFQTTYFTAGERPDVVN